MLTIYYAWIVIGMNIVLMLLIAKVYTVMFTGQDNQASMFNSAS